VSRHRRAVSATSRSDGAPCPADLAAIRRRAWESTAYTAAQDEFETVMTALALQTA
jgi:hypothetical protein